MKVTPQLYPKLFTQLKAAVNKEIAKHNIIVGRKKFKTNVGRAFPNESVIKIPKITDIESVYVIFHEIAHIKFNHCLNPFKRTYMQELEAEQYALKSLRRFNIHKLFPKNYAFIRERAISYIIINILYEIADGLKVKQITSSALQFCKMKPRNTLVFKKKKKK